MGKAPSTQTVTQKTEIDPIQKSFLFGTPLPDDYRKSFDARNARIMGMPVPEPDKNAFGKMLYNQFAPGSEQGYTRGIMNPEAEGYRPNQGKANGGLIALANGGMVPPTMPGGGMPNLSNREQAYLMGAQALQGAMQPQPMMGMQQPQPMMQGYAMGGYVEGPGTGRSDDIPATIYQNGVPVQDAALSDGEFVMTERAVRNAGGGDREAGAARMYEMMRRFENGGTMT